MFSYFGSKSKIIHLYPKPVYPLIIEPFCGSARYACRYYDHDVWINDIYPVVYRIWKWIQGATRQDVRNLPEMKYNELLSDYKQLSDTERDLLGFTIGMGKSAPYHKVTKMATARGNRSRGAIFQLKTNLLELVGRLSHWKITNLSYDQIPNCEAAWFVDPPYSKFKDQKTYKYTKINYSHLSQWCLSRKGQVIVCEAGGADWLPFKSFLHKSLNTMKARTLRKEGQKIKGSDEVVWTKCDKQVGLFALGKK